MDHWIQITNGDYHFSHEKLRVNMLKKIRLTPTQTSSRFGRRGWGADKAKRISQAKKHNIKT